MLQELEKCRGKLKKNYLVIAILIGAGFLSVINSTYAEGKIGFVDLSNAFDDYQKTKDFDKMLEKKSNNKQEEREKIVKEIRKIREEMALLNESAKEAKEKEIEVKIKDLQEFDQEAKTELIKERDDMVRDILEEMNVVIREYGVSNGYTVILNERVLLYGDKTLDVTDEIIRILNNRFKKL